jgi:hypothetical protein
MAGLMSKNDQKELFISMKSVISPQGVGYSEKI